MSETRWTPGKWSRVLSQRRSPKHPPSWRIRNDAGEYICSIFGGPSAAADASLIAEAKALYEALEYALKCADSDGAASALAALNTHGRAALAAARGETP